jgi:hypothetical protein
MKKIAFCFWKEISKKLVLVRGREIEIKLWEVGKRKKNLNL